MNKLIRCVNGAISFGILADHHYGERINSFDEMPAVTIKLVNQRTARQHIVSFYIVNVADDLHRYDRVALREKIASEIAQTLRNTNKLLDEDEVFWLTDNEPVWFDHQGYATPEWIKLSHEEQDEERSKQWVRHEGLAIADQILQAANPKQWEERDEVVVSLTSETTQNTPEHPLPVATVWFMKHKIKAVVLDHLPPDNYHVTEPRSWTMNEPHRLSSNHLQGMNQVPDNIRHMREGLRRSGLTGAVTLSHHVIEWTNHNNQPLWIVYLFPVEEMAMWFRQDYLIEQVIEPIREHIEVSRNLFA